LPERVKQAADAIIHCNSAEKAEAVKAWVNDTSVFSSQYSENLIQFEPTRNLGSGNWTCDVCGGGATTNLWLNLTDGHIGCGRRNFDGSGGQGHALEHYKKNGYPLVVKLGTITADGADVHSYPEDALVIDKFLEKHLLHWGLDMKVLKKTDKTVAELEIEFQSSYEWLRAQEKTTQLVPVYGPGFTGIQNLGNTCYMASIFQVLFKIPEYIDRYFKHHNAIIQSAYLPDAPRDFHVQLAKLGHGILSGEYSKPEEKSENEEIYKPLKVVKPTLLKSIIGENHQEFSSNRQQDAAEFFQYFVQLNERKEHGKGEGINPASVFKFSLEERLECSTSHSVKYSIVDKQISLSLPIPVEKASNLPEVEAYNQREAKKTPEQKKEEINNGKIERPIYPRVTLLQCFQEWSSPELIEGWYSSAVKGKTIAIKTKKFADFPRYLVLQMSKFRVTGLTFSKLDVSLDVPDLFDLESLRGSGRKPGEKEFPAEEEKLQFDENIISQLQQMGYSRTRAEHAIYNNKGANVEVIMEWLFAHMDDASIDKPLKVTSSAQTTPKATVDENAIGQLMQMGFARARCIKALQETSNSFERALDWLFSHMEEPEESAPTLAPQNTSQPVVNNTPGRYKLLGFVTHMGRNTDTGHYVAHIRSGDKWVLYNDMKVTESQDPPRELAYIYFYKREDQ